MTITQDFFVNVLTLFKENNFYCEFQSGYDHLMKGIKQCDNVMIVEDYSAYFPLNEKNKKILIENVLKYHSEKYMNYFEIKSSENIPLFCSYDSFEIAEIASEIQLSENFIEKYVKTELCIVLDKIIYPHDQLQYNIQPMRIKF